MYQGPGKFISMLFFLVFILRIVMLCVTQETIVPSREPNSSYRFILTRLLFLVFLSSCEQGPLD